MGAYTYRDSGVEWLGKVPEHWKVDRLKDRVSVNARTLGAKTPGNLEIQYLDISNVNSLGIFDHDGFQQLTFDSAPSRARRIVSKYDSVISSVRTNLQAVAYIDFDIKNLIASTGFFVCHPIFTSILLPKFVYYFLLSEYSRHFFFSRSIGVSYPAIDDYDFGSIKMPLPSVVEQQAIIVYIDQVWIKINAAIKVKRQQLSQLEVIEKSIINQASLKGINPKATKQKIDSVWFNELPAHWEIKRLKDVSDMQTGITLGKDFTEETEERPYMRVANVQDGHLALNNMKTINMPPRLIPRYELRDGDVLMTEGGDLDKLGRGQVWRSQIAGCLHQNHVFALRCYPHKLLPDYLALLTSSTHGRAYFEIMGKKTTNLASINSTKVNLFPVPLPPIDEQKKIIEWVQKKRDKIQQARSAVSEQIEVLEKYRKSLIHECVTGKKQVYQGAINCSI